jgi:hypothetical protein
MRRLSAPEGENRAGGGMARNLDHTAPLSFSPH